ncbi:Ger(x)C family spore germination protein [Alkalihalophilus lindianensis]|uniref:Ger(X)C family spore germination protein n=1 Tax=Alkalihalophilus lindianensis TaxID=1630542 RepID=A0ABU3X5U6_9BACI|nr:Ger(x)C family spore germination protein [Alkalihalophilus lindianensis]MDV2682982.1 Ger(x)C family spore germination protein [Alkalihalophilus lindianensis]
MWQLVKIYSVVLLLVFSFVLTGCNDVKELQNSNYATAIGVDYKDGKYESYIQMVNLDQVATTEGGGRGEPQMLVSKAVANTFEEAFFEVYKTAQERIIWAHVTSIVLSETAINEGFQHIYDALTRYYEFRLTPWVFGTNDSIEEVLSITGFFAKTSLDTIMHNPIRSYEQSSMIRPIKLQRLAREMFEPSQTTYVPSITIDHTQWDKNREDEPKLMINGAFFIQNQHYKGFFNLDELKGLRWTIPDTQRASLVVPDEINTEFVLILKDPTAKISSEVEGNSPSFVIHIKAKGYFTNRMNNHNLLLGKIIEDSKEKLKDEIKQLYQLGIEKNVDFLNLEHELYRKHSTVWKQLKEDGKIIINEDSLNNVTVDLTLKHTGAVLNKTLDIKNIE